jgi:hypothetical protein
MFPNVHTAFRIIPMSPHTSKNKCTLILSNKTKLFLTLKEEYRLGIYENRMLKKTYGPKRGR